METTVTNDAKLQALSLLIEAEINAQFDRLEKVTQLVGKGQMEAAIHFTPSCLVLDNFLKQYSIIQKQQNNVN